MRRPIFFAVALFWLLPVMAQQPAAQEFKFAVNQSVYVIAVKSPAPPGPDTWRQLNRSLPMPPGAGSAQASSQNAPSGRQTLERPQNERPTLEKSQTERTTLERDAPIRRMLPPIETGLKKSVEEEFLKQKKFKLADSPETADFIFFAHGEYVYSLIAASGRGGGGVIFGSSMQGDTSMELNTLARLSVAAIPASEYRQWQSDIPNLFEKARWQEVAWGQFHRDQEMRYEDPPTKKLVQQFHKQALKK